MSSDLSIKSYKCSDHCKNIEIAKQKYEEILMIMKNPVFKIPSDFMDGLKDPYSWGHDDYYCESLCIPEYMHIKTKEYFIIIDYIVMVDVSFLVRPTGECDECIAQTNIKDKSTFLEILSKLENEEDFTQMSEITQYAMKCVYNEVKKSCSEKYYGCFTNYANIFSKKYCDDMCVIYTPIPNSEYKKYCVKKNGDIDNKWRRKLVNKLNVIVFASGKHKRLGKKSPVRLLDKFLCDNICKLVVTK
jgi:hypothetical protein